MHEYPAEMSVPPLDLLFPFPGSPSSADSFLALTTPPDTILASPINCHLSLDTLDALDKLDQQDKLFTPPSSINPILTHSDYTRARDKPQPQPKHKHKHKQPSPEAKPDTASLASVSPNKRKAKELKDTKDAKDNKDAAKDKDKDGKNAKRDKPKADAAMDDNHGPSSQSPMPPIRPRPIAAAANSTTAPAIASSSTVLIERRKRGRKRYSCAECRR